MEAQGLRICWGQIGSFLDAKLVPMNMTLNNLESKFMDLKIDVSKQVAVLRNYGLGESSEASC